MPSYTDLRDFFQSGFLGMFHVRNVSIRGVIFFQGHHAPSLAAASGAPAP